MLETLLVESQSLIITKELLNPSKNTIALLNRRWLTGAHRRDARATINVDGGKGDRPRHRTFLELGGSH